jgi:hypothetical protein
LDIVGPFNIFRPFAKMEIEEKVEGERAAETLEEITDAHDG